MAVRFADCTRRQHLKREASATRFAQTADTSLSVSGTGDASPSNGISLQRQLQRQLQLQRQRSLRGATSNGKCRSAGNGKSNSRQAEQAFATRRRAAPLPPMKLHCSACTAIQRFAPMFCMGPRSFGSSSRTSVGEPLVEAGLTTSPERVYQASAPASVSIRNSCLLRCSAGMAVLTV